MQRLGVLLIAAFVVVAPAAQATEASAQRGPQRRHGAGAVAARGGADPNVHARDLFAADVRGRQRPCGNDAPAARARRHRRPSRPQRRSRAVVGGGARSCRNRADVCWRRALRCSRTTIPIGPRHSSRRAGYARVEVVRVLLAAGADARRRGQSNDTALHQAAIAGNAAIITMLLAAGADPGAVGSLNTTPLHARRLSAGWMPSDCWQRPGPISTLATISDGHRSGSRPRAAT